MKKHILLYSSLIFSLLLVMTFSANSVATEGSGYNEEDPNLKKSTNPFALEGQAKAPYVDDASASEQVDPSCDCHRDEKALVRTDNGPSSSSQSNTSDKNGGRK